MTTKNKAFLCGINAYPGAPLAGCLNDVSDMATFLNTKCGFPSSGIRLLSDKRATTAAILSRLAWLVQGAAPGDKLFFLFSGHGAQVATRDSVTEEVDGLDEVICPYGFDWSDPHMIRDNDFERIFSTVPDGVQFIWVSDSCHSGSLEKEMPAMGQTKRDKGFPTPVDIAWRSKVAVDLGHAPKKSAPNLALISGCKSNQTSADARFAGRANGALTYYLLKALSSSGGLSLPLTTIIQMVQGDLKKTGYSQVPQLEGNLGLMQRSFFGK
jgi:hypothetical protein